MFSTFINELLISVAKCKNPQYHSQKEIGHYAYFRFQRSLVPRVHLTFGHVLTVQKRIAYKDEVLGLVRPLQVNCGRKIHCWS